MEMDADRWDELRAAAERECRRLHLTELEGWIESVGPRRPAARRVPRRSLGSAVALGLLGAGVMIAAAVAVRSYLDARAVATASSATATVAPVGVRSRVAVEAALVAAATAVAATAAPDALEPVSPSPLDPEPTPEPARKRPPARRAPKPSPVAPVVSSSSASPDGLAALHAAVAQAPASPWLRYHLAAEFEARGNPMGAVRQLDYMRTLDTPSARRALDRAAHDPDLARWTHAGWWSARQARAAHRPDVAWTPPAPRARMPPAPPRSPYQYRRERRDAGTR